MPTVSGDIVQAQLQWRYATKKFDPTRVISDADWRVLAESLVLSPSSYGLQPWKFFVVMDPAIKAQLPALSWRQTQPLDCSHMVVLAIKKNMDAEHIDRFVNRTVEVRGGSSDALAGYRKMMVGSLLNPSVDIDEWASRQVYIALGQFMACAALMGIDTCPMEGIEYAKYDELLGLPALGYATCVGCAAGYRADDDKYAGLTKVRFETDDVVQVI